MKTSAIQTLVNESTPDQLARMGIQSHIYRDVHTMSIDQSRAGIHLEAAFVKKALSEQTPAQRMVIIFDAAEIMAKFKDNLVTDGIRAEICDDSHPGVILDNAHQVVLVSTTTALECNLDRFHSIVYAKHSGWGKLQSAMAMKIDSMIKRRMLG